MTLSSCSYPGCDRPHRARGYCSVHYYQFRRTGTVFDIVPAGTPQHIGCKITDCPRPHFARGWCQTHHRRLWTRFAKYGITGEQYDELVQAQGDTCAICKIRQEVYSVDHDHACCPGETSCGACVRGLLCRNCNTGIGMLGDDAGRLCAAADYLGRR